MTAAAGLLAVIQRDAPWVVRVEHDATFHVLRLYDVSGDWRSFPCVAFRRGEKP